MATKTKTKKPKYVGVQAKKNPRRIGGDAPLVVAESIKDAVNAKPTDRPRANLLNIGDAPEIDKGHVLPVIAGASQKDFRYHSESEVIQDHGTDAVIANANTIRQRLEKAVKDKGKKVFVCPICNPGASKDYATKEACNKHMKGEHRMKMAEIRLTKGPKEFLVPKVEYRLKKEDRLDAILHPAMKKHMEAVKAAREVTEPIREKQLLLAGRGSDRVTTMIQQTESQAIAQLKNLSPTEVAQLYRLAQNRGKRLLMRACHKVMQNKPVTPMATGR